MTFFRFKWLNRRIIAHIYSMSLITIHDDYFFYLYKNPRFLPPKNHLTFGPKIWTFFQQNHIINGWYISFLLTASCMWSESREVKMCTGKKNNRHMKITWFQLIRVDFEDFWYKNCNLVPPWRFLIQKITNQMS